MRIRSGATACAEGPRARARKAVDRPRIGVVGVGAVGFHHARVVAELAGVELAGVYDVRPDRAREVARALAVRFRPSLDALLDGCDAVVVAVPTSAHEAVAGRALDAGRSVLVEKPLAPDVAAADRILAAAEAAGATVLVGHSERFNPAVLAAARFIESPRFIESQRMAPFTSRGSDVAVVLDLMIHDVDLVMSLVGTPLHELAAAGVGVLTPSVDIANARLTFAGGAVANLTASRVSRERLRMVRVFQPSGYVRLDLAAARGEFLRLRDDLEVRCATGDAGRMGSDLGDVVETVPFEGDGAEPLVRQMENFRDAVRGAAEPVVSGAAGRAALAVALAIQERIERHVVDTRPP